jgi:hypothetical protein
MTATKHRAELRQQIRQAVRCAETASPSSVAAFLIGWLIAEAEFDPDERDRLDRVLCRPARRAGP